MYKSSMKSVETGIDMTMYSRKTVHREISVVFGATSDRGRVKDMLFL
jgi:hypothetical protein